MEKNLSPRVLACRAPCLPAADRRRLVRILLVGVLALPAAALAGCAEDSYARNNRHPDMRHGNFEDPGTRAVDR
jgi:hypothetical protein